MKLTELIPSWVYWLVIGILAAFVGIQQLRVSGLKVEIATEKQSRSDENAKRMSDAMAFQKILGDKEVAHATQQQQKDDEYAKAFKKLQADRAVDIASNGRLRRTIETYTAFNRRPGESDTAYIERARNRLETIGRLLEGGTQLVTESLGIIARRDLEVGRLLEQIKIDRLACSATTNRE